MQARLSASDLACRRGDRLLFHGLSFALEAGEALHITGANGVGKTSLLQILAGLLTPFAGQVTRTGALGLLDERIALDPERPLAKALEFWAAIDGQSDPGPACRALDLEALVQVPIRYLSTGQRKRAALARMLGQGAPIWLLDEPLSGLDTAAQDRVKTLIDQHLEQGGICLFASHQMMAIKGLQSLALEDFAPPNSAPLAPAPSAPAPAAPMPLNPALPEGAKGGPPRGGSSAAEKEGGACGS